MKLPERTIWLHGSAFVVRKLPRGVAQPMRPKYEDWRKPYRNYADMAQTLVIFYQGRFLARVRPDMLKRWLNYYARRLLTLGHT